MSQSTIKKIDFHLSLSASKLIEKLALYQLHPNDFNRGFYIDQERIERLSKQLEMQSHSEEFSELLDVVSTWPVIFTLSFTAINDKVNQFISTFLEWHKKGGNAFNNVEVMIQCIHIRTLFPSQKSYQFQLFLFGLISETVSHYNQLKLHYYEQHDPLSALPNHRFLQQLLTKTNSGQKENAALMILSINSESNVYNPKINDEKLINHVISLLTSDLISNAKLFHTDYNELTLYFDRVLDRTRIELVATKIRRLFDHALLIDNDSFFIRPKLAFSYGALASTTGTDLLKQAQLALENAKISDESIICYSPQVKSTLDQQRLIEHEIVSAFNQGEFTLHFQPIIQLSTQNCVGAECLLRWASAPKSFTPPMIIDVLNKRGLSNMFIRWLINTAFRIGKSLIDHAHNNDFYLSINLQPEDLVDE